MKRAAAIAVLLALASCGEPRQFAAARMAVAAKFAYPGSAEFADVRLGSDGATVCGRVRGRGVAGDMTDLRRFRWSPGSGAIVEGLDAPSGIDDLDRSHARVTDAMLAIGCD